jgi:hypothetical protein
MDSERLPGDLRLFVVHHIGSFNLCIPICCNILLFAMIMFNNVQTGRFEYKQSRYKYTQQNQDRGKRERFCHTTI